MAPREQETSATTGLGLQGGTLLRGGMVGLALLLLLGGVTWLFSEQAPASPLERYRRLGATAGAAALQRDLLAAFPPGTPPVPLLRRLESLGFGCLPAGEGWRCAHAAPGEGRRVWRAEVTLGLAGGDLANLDARMTEGAP